MIHNIAFHADIDGIFCAALTLRQCGKNYRLYPLLSSSRGEKFQGLVNSMNLQKDDKLYVMDFEYHPRADLWVDHHNNMSMGAAPINNNKTAYDPSSASAFSLLASHHDAKDCAGVVEIVNMIDMAQYPSVKFIFTDDSPAMIIRAYLERAFPSDMLFSRIAEAVASLDFDLDAVISRFHFTDECVTKLRQDANKAKEFMEIYGNFSLVRQRRTSQFPRYSEAFVKPEVKYNVRISSLTKGKWHLQVGYNVWSEENNDINIGKFLSKLDYIRGGGHFHVGGGLLFDSDVEKFIDDFDKLVNPEKEEEMEKYGVDKESDSFEKAADDMVKTGEAKDIDEARKKIDEKQEEVSAGEQQPAASQ